MFKTAAPFRKPLIIGSLVGSGVVFLITINIGGMLFRFLAVGEIPGTSLSVSSNGMFALLGLTVLAALFFLLPSSRRDSIGKQTKQHLPKRRYSRL